MVASAVFRTPLIGAVLALALIIDVMKPASLGFVTPGMRTEYGIDRATVALLPFSALLGTAVGSFVWGSLADLYGRRAAILQRCPGSRGYIGHSPDTARGPPLLW